MNGGDMIKFYAFAGALVMLASGDAFSQMMKPVFNPELAKLSFIVGDYKTRTEVTVGENPSVGTGTVRARWALDSMFIVIRGTEDNPALGSYKSIGLLGYDSENSQYVLSMFNNFGEHPEYKGNFIGDTLTLTAKIVGSQGPFDQELKWFKNGNKVRLQFFANFGKGYTKIIDQTSSPGERDGG